MQRFIEMSNIFFRNFRKKNQFPSQFKKKKILDLNKIFERFIFQAKCSKKSRYQTELSTKKIHKFRFNENPDLSKNTKKSQYKKTFIENFDLVNIF